MTRDNEQCWWWFIIGGKGGKEWIEFLGMGTSDQVPSLILLKSTNQKKYCQTPVLAKSNRQGVEFVFPLSQPQSGSQHHQNKALPDNLGS